MTPPILTHNNIWTPSETFWRIYNKSQSTILKEYPDMPCVYCRRMLYGLGNQIFSTGQAYTVLL